MTVVVGTAGHIDHGKTALLRALTGIDADRLPEERRRGMTIDVGYAHLRLPDGSELDFVDVPGHDRLVGNMLVGAGEIDAVLLVIAADDGPRAQTHEHLALIDALGIRPGVVALTKIDLVAPDRVVEVADGIRAMVAGTTLEDAPVLPVSAHDGSGLAELSAALVELRDEVLARLAAESLDSARPVRLAIDRAFVVRGRGVVATGSLRGGRLERGAHLRLMPDGRTGRAREIQVHGSAVERVVGGGRVALNLAGIEAADLHRGMVLTTDPQVVASSTVVALLSPGPARTREPVGRAWPPRPGATFRLHLGTDQVEAILGRGRRDHLLMPDGRLVARLRLAHPVAVADGDRFLLRRDAPDPQVT
ncbi:MAG: selenocysteine-specific translation elongation factor, partial [Candidatus Limnocylindrales bacterium]